MEDYINVSLTAELLEERGVATEILRVCNIAPFLVLKALAYEDRVEEKDAYDLIYCLTNYRTGPDAVAEAFASLEARLPGDPLLARALAILQQRFTSGSVEGHRKDGPISYARFLADPGRSERDVLHRRNAAAVVEAFLAEVERRRSRSWIC